MTTKEKKKFDEDVAEFSAMIDYEVEQMRPKKKNGNIIDGRVYCRKYDFSRDSVKNLIQKIVSWSSNEKLQKFAPEIRIVLKQRVHSGHYTKEYILNLLDRKRSNEYVLSLKRFINEI